MCAYITHSHTFALVCIQTHWVSETEGWEANVVMLPRTSTVSLVMIIVHYLFLLLHMTRLFSQFLSFCSHLNCLSLPMLNQWLQKQRDVREEEEMMILDMQKSCKKPTWSKKLTTLHQKRLPLTSCKYFTCYAGSNLATRSWYRGKLFIKKGSLNHTKQKTRLDLTGNLHATAIEVRSKGGVFSSVSGNSFTSLGLTWQAGQAWMQLTSLCHLQHGWVCLSQSY